MNFASTFFCLQEMLACFFAFNIELLCSIFCNNFMKEKECSNIMCVREQLVGETNQYVIHFFYCEEQRTILFRVFPIWTSLKMFVFNVFFGVSILVELVVFSKLNFLIYSTNKKMDTIKPIWKTNITKNCFLIQCNTRALTGA